MEKYMVIDSDVTKYISVSTTKTKNHLLRVHNDVKFAIFDKNGKRKKPISSSGVKKCDFYINVNGDFYLYKEYDKIYLMQQIKNIRECSISGSISDLKQEDVEYKALIYMLNIHDSYGWNTQVLRLVPYDDTRVYLELDTIVLHY